MPTLLYMIDFGGQIGLSIEKASLLATVHGMGQVAGVLVIMPLSDYLGRKKTILADVHFGHDYDPFCS